MADFVAKPRKFKRVRRGLVTIHLGTHPDSLSDDVLSKIAAAGFETIQVPILDVSIPDAFGALARRAAEHGLICSAVGVCPNINDPAQSTNPGGTREERERFLAFADKLINSAARLRVADGQRIMLVGPFAEPLGGAAKDTTVGGPEWRAAVETIAEMSHRAYIAGVDVLLEWLNRWEQRLVCSPQRGRAFIEEVCAIQQGKPQLSGLFDTHHEHIEGKSPTQDLHDFLPVLGGFHASENTRGVCGNGQVDFAVLFRALKLAGVGTDKAPLEIWIEMFSRSDPGLAAATCVWHTEIEPGEELSASGYALRHIDRCLDAAEFDLMPAS